MYKALGFDLEIAGELPEEGEIDWSVPLGVTCVGLATEGYSWWHAPAGLDTEMYDERFRSVRSIVEELEHWREMGYYIVTWNGMGFDFRVLAQETSEDPELYDRICDLAWNHIDIAFQMRVEKGYMIGLNTAAQGLNLQGKTEGMSGSLAPQMWKQGFDEQMKVLEYVAQDAQATLDVYNRLVEQRVLFWTTKGGYKTKSPWHPTVVGIGNVPATEPPYRLPTVKEVTRYSAPADTSWMSFEPRPIDSYYSWTGIYP